MAENAANFTQTLQSKPSIFEIIAQTSLGDTLHPALQKVALFFSTNFPRHFSWLSKYYEETYLVINCLLQTHYLKHYDSSFCENFYGLKRVLVSNSPLSDEDKLISLLIIVLMPYFKRKLEEKLTVYRIEHAEGCLKKDYEGRLKKLILFTHSSFEVSWNIYTIINYLKYMSNSTEHQLPILQLINMKLIHEKNDDLNAGFWTSLFKGELGLSELSVGLFKNGVTTSFEITAFFLQFLHAWNDQKANYNISDLPIVSPPPIDNKAKTFKGKCPICLQRWTIPTTLQVSGYIFCFRCILKYVSENQKCPITHLPAKHLDIIRLYIND